MYPKTNRVEPAADLFKHKTTLEHYMKNYAASSSGFTPRQFFAPVH
jgi:hypothetical protein